MIPVRSFSYALVLTLFAGGSRHALADWIAGSPVRLDPASSSVADFGIGTSDDHLELYFNYCVAFNQDCDLRVATRSTAADPFSNAELLGQGINSPANEFYPTLAPDGLELIFTDAILPPFDNNMRRLGGLGGGDLWRATRSTTDEPFANVENLGEIVNSASLESYPSLSPDGLSLFFSSTRPGGEGGADLYMTTRPLLSEPFEPPVNLGPSINTSANEGRATVHPTGLALVFDSNRPGGVGNLDLWLSERRAVESPWEPAENLTSINTSTLESGPHFSSDGSKLYFESIRSPNFGFGSDLWQVAIESPSVPEPLHGDYDNSGQVEQADLDLVLLNWGASAAPIPDGWINDLPSGNVDQNELDGVLLNWGNMASISATNSVSEPATWSLILLLIASATMSARRFDWRRHAGRLLLALHQAIGWFFHQIVRGRRDLRCPMFGRAILAAVIAATSSSVVFAQFGESPGLFIDAYVVSQIFDETAGANVFEERPIDKEVSPHNLNMGPISDQASITKDLTGATSNGEQLNVAFDNSVSVSAEFGRVVIDSHAESNSSDSIPSAFMASESQVEAGWFDQFAIFPNDSSLNGRTATIEFSLVVDGTLNASISGATSNHPYAESEYQVDIDLGSFSPDIPEGGIEVRPTGQTSSGVVALPHTFVLERQIVLGLEDGDEMQRIVLSASGEANIGGGSGPGDTLRADADLHVTWNGISRIQLDDGSEVSLDDVSTRSLSGFNYLGPDVCFIASGARGVCESRIIWEKPISGEFENADNWLPDVVPGAGATAEFSRVGTYTVFLNESYSVGAVEVRGGDVNVTLESGGTSSSRITATALDLGLDSTDDVLLTLDNVTIDLGKGTANIGAVEGGDARLAVNGGELTAATINVGTVEEGHIVMNGGALTTNHLRIADERGNNSSVTVGLAVVTVNGNIDIGAGKRGVFKQLSGAVDVNGDGTTSIRDNSLLDIRGASEWSQPQGELSIEWGTVEIADGGDATFNKVRIVPTSGDKPGIVRVLANSKLTVKEELNVGALHGGTLEVQSQGQLIAKDVNVGTMQVEVPSEAEKAKLSMLGGTATFSGNVTIGSTDSEVLRSTRFNVDGGAAVTVTTPKKTTVLPGGELEIRNGSWEQVNSGDLMVVGGIANVFDNGSAKFDRIKVTNFEGDATGSIGVIGLIRANDTVTIGNGEGRAVVTLLDGVIEAGNKFRVLLGGELRGYGVARANHFEIADQGSVSPTVQRESGARGVPNPIGMLVLDGDYTQSEGGTMLLDVAGTKAGEFDIVEITGDAVIEGPVILSFIDGFAPKAGQQFGALLDVAGTTDVTSAQFIVQNLAGDFEYDITPMDNVFMLTALTDGVFQQAIPGDYDNSGQVEQADLDLVLLNWGATATPIPNGWINHLPTDNIDQNELDGVLLNWGNTIIPAATSSATSTPEPATLSHTRRSGTGDVGCGPPESMNVR